MKKMLLTCLLAAVTSLPVTAQAAEREHYGSRDAQTNTLLACRAEGLGCVLTTLLCMHEPAVRELLEIPEPWGTAAHIPIGYPVGKGHGPISRRPPEKLCFNNKFGQPM